jgi:hypothetical protein
MGLLSKKAKAPKAPKIICPSCGKPNPGLSEAAVPRCILCNGVLPVQTQPTAGLGSAPAPDTAPIAAMGDDPTPTAADWSSQLETFDAGALEAPQFAKVAQGRAGVPQDEGFESFDFGALQVGQPALPRPSSND